MSELSLPSDAAKDVSQASFSPTQKVIKIQNNTYNEEKKNAVEAGDALDDSSSSYCTAHCSLSDYSEAFEDELPCTEPASETVLSEFFRNELNALEKTSTDSSFNIDVIPQELQTRDSPNNGALLQDSVNEKNKMSSSFQNPFMWESKYFLSGPKVTIVNFNLTNITPRAAESDSATKHEPSMKDFLSNDDEESHNNSISTDIESPQKLGLSKPRLILDPCFIIEKNSKKEHNEERTDMQTKDSDQQSSRKPHYNLSTECKPDGGDAFIGHLKWEGENQATEDGNEQAGLSLKAGNRKLPASCTSTCTANQQESGILPRCYSKRILTTTNQHHCQSPSDSQWWQRQNQQGVCSSSLPPLSPGCGFRKHSSIGDKTNRINSMATKVAGTTTLDHSGSSCIEANYLGVFNSTNCTSAQLCSDGDFHNWSKDVLSFKSPLMSMDHLNTSTWSDASSFECVDVACESYEEATRNVKTVPKRQIQLKRRENSHSRANENGSSLEVPSTPSRPRDILQRQHSTPAAFHQNSDGLQTISGQTELRKLQKSLSLDETSGKNKTASGIIKNVLSKRMQHEQNIRSVDAPDQVLNSTETCSLTSYNDMSSSAKEVSSDSSHVNLPTTPLLDNSISTQDSTLKTESQATGRSIKEHTSVSSKTQPKLMTKHSFSPLFCGPGKPFQSSVTEMNALSDPEKERPSPNKEAQITGHSTKEQLSCDSAKGTAWNSSEVISRVVGKQALVKTIPEECCPEQRSHKQHNVKNHLITCIKKQEKPGERKESTHCPTLAEDRSLTQDTSTLDNIKPQSTQCNPERDQQSGTKECSPPGLSANTDLQCQGKFKAVAPVHVVRDLRSLVKSTYSQSFGSSGEKAQGLKDPVDPGLSKTTSQSSSGKNKEKIFKHDKKLNEQKATRPSSLERAKTFLNSTSGYATKVTSVSKSHDKISHSGYKKVVSVRPAQTNLCASKFLEKENSPSGISQADILGSNTNIQQTNQPAMPIKSHEGITTNLSKTKQPVTIVRHQSQLLINEPQNCLPKEISEQQDIPKFSNQNAFTVNDVQQSPDPPSRSQSSTGPPSTCILAVAPTPVFPSYFYKPGPLSYQAVSPHMGAISYIQGPVLLQTPALNQPSTVSGPVPLIRSLSLEERKLSQPFSADSDTVQPGLSKQTEKEGPRLKMPSADTQQCTPFITTLGVESVQGSANILNPEVGGNLAPRHLLLDPETGQCFYVDMPQLPQRKMLFDPETCQYVEVVLPQQTLSSPVMTPSVPFPSLHLPAVYAPHCLSYVQAHPQMLPPSGP